MKLSIVTGANKGIGFEIARGLLEQVRSKNRVILACRNATLGQAAENELAKTKAEGNDVQFLPLDIGNPDSIDSFVNSIKSKFGEVDLLVNNAAIAFKGSDPTPFEGQARPTVMVNYFGTVNLTRQILPMMREGSRIVNLASGSGHLKILPDNTQGTTLREKFTSSNLTEEELDDIMRAFVRDVESGDVDKQLAWPKTCYGMSKLGIISWTKILARLNPGIVINSVCPGWCSTDMSSHQGPRSAKKGAETPLMLALDPTVVTSGGFYRDYAELEW